MLRKIQSIMNRLSFEAHETQTAQGRTAERYRLAAWNSLTHATSSASGMISLLIIIPLTLSNLGTERFGIWMSLASLATILSFMDMGIGNGLVNLITQANAEKSHRLKQITIRGISTLAAIGAATGILLITAIEIISNIKTINSINYEILEETQQAATIFSILFSLSIPLFGIQRIFFGLQKSWISNTLKTIGYILSSILVYFLTKTKTTISELLIATYGLQTIIIVLAIPLLWREVSSDPIPPNTSKILIKNDIKSLLGVGWVFFALQIGGIVGWGCDTLIATTTLGPDAATPLTIVQRLFQFVTLPMLILNGSLWAAYSDAYVRKDIDFIKKTLKKSLIITFTTSTVTSLFIFIFSNEIITLWLGPEHLISTSLLAAFALWAIIDATGNCFGMYLNGCNIINIQLKVVLFFCLMAIPLKFILSTLIGTTGIVLATSISYIACIALPYITYLNKYVSINQFSK